MAMHWDEELLLFCYPHLPWKSYTCIKLNDNCTKNYNVIIVTSLKDSVLGGY